jgi:hypothetical protein
VPEILHLAGMRGDRHGPFRKSRIDPLRLDIEVCLLAAGKDHLSALLGQRLGNGAADAATPAGDERDPPVEAESISSTAMGLDFGGFWHG